MDTIREYKAADARGLEECFAELQEAERRFDPRLGSAASVMGAYLEHMFTRCAETAGEVFVAEAAGQVVGFVSVWARVRSRAVEEVKYEYALVSDLVVLPGHRGRGLGRALLRKAEGHAARCGARTLRLAVMADNLSARRLYQGCGFRERVVELEKVMPGGGGARAGSG